MIPHADDGEFPAELLRSKRPGGGGGSYMPLAGGTFTGHVQFNDDVQCKYGSSGDVIQAWDTAETTDLFKIGLPSGGKGLVVGPVGDIGVDRYGASPPEFGLWARGDDAVALNRIGMYMDSSIGYLHCTRYQLRIKLGSANYLTISDSSGMNLGTAVTQKVGFYGTTPVVQQTHIADPAGGATVDAEARAAINSVNVLCATLGLTAAA